MKNTTSNPVAPAISRFKGRESLEAYLCERIVGLLRDGIDARGEATIAVSGGRTPTALFQLLSEQPLAWNKITVVLVDERWVDAGHEASNERLVRLNLLQNAAEEAHFIGLKTGATSAAEGMDELQQRLAVLPRPLDAVILGMGEDGHTASFFPGAPTLGQALDLNSGHDCQAVTPVDAPHERITLALSRLLDSRQIFIHLYGDSKLPVLDRAMSSGPEQGMPVRAVLRQRQTPVEICWAP